MGRIYISAIRRDEANEKISHMCVHNIESSEELPNLTEHKMGEGRLTPFLEVYRLVDQGEAFVFANGQVGHVVRTMLGGQYERLMSYDTDGKPTAALDALPKC